MRVHDQVGLSKTQYLAKDFSDSARAAAAEARAMGHERRAQEHMSRAKQEHDAADKERAEGNRSQAADHEKAGMEHEHAAAAHRRAADSQSADPKDPMVAGQYRERNFASRFANAASGRAKTASDEAASSWIRGEPGSHI